MSLHLEDLAVRRLGVREDIGPLPEGVVQTGVAASIEALRPKGGVRNTSMFLCTICIYRKACRSLGSMVDVNLHTEMPANPVPGTSLRIWLNFLSSLACEVARASTDPELASCQSLHAKPPPFRHTLASHKHLSEPVAPPSGFADPQLSISYSLRSLFRGALVAFIMSSFIWQNRPIISQAYLT